jgi:hypothetical protein
MKRWASGVGLMIVLGLALRCYHFFREPSIWCDEAWVMANVLDKDYSQLCGPLENTQAAPCLFLWMEKCAVQTLGDAPWVWRLAPFLASCAALLLFAYVARQLLSPSAACWVVMLFACSDRLLWHTAEVKPYAIDLFCAAAILAVYCRVCQASLHFQLLLWTAISPLLIFLSYPGCMLCGGIATAMALAIMRKGNTQACLLYGGFLAVVLGCFLLLLVGPVASQRNPDLMQYWTSFMPDWTRPWTVPSWTVRCTGGMLLYCCKPIGGFLAPMMVLGAIGWWRRGRSELIGLLTVPIVLAVVAAYLHQYPFGHTRLELYCTPAVLLLVGFGLPPAFAWLRAHALWSAGLLAGLLLAPLAHTAYRVVHPWDVADSRGAAAYVQSRFQPGDEVVCDQCEYAYYFRTGGPAPHGGVTSPRTGSLRSWIVVGGISEEIRQEAVQRVLAAGWHILERHDHFTFTSVLLASSNSE